MHARTGAYSRRPAHFGIAVDYTPVGSWINARATLAADVRQLILRLFDRQDQFRIVVFHVADPLVDGP